MSFPRLLVSTGRASILFHGDWRKPMRRPLAVGLGGRQCPEPQTCIAHCQITRLQQAPRAGTAAPATCTLVLSACRYCPSFVYTVRRSFRALSLSYSLAPVLRIVFKRICRLDLEAAAAAWEQLFSDATHILNSRESYWVALP